MPYCGAAECRMARRNLRITPPPGGEGSIYISFECSIAHNYAPVKRENARRHEGAQLIQIDEVAVLLL